MFNYEWWYNWDSKGVKFVVKKVRIGDKLVEKGYIIEE